MSNGFARFRRRYQFGTTVACLVFVIGCHSRGTSSGAGETTTTRPDTSGGMSGMNAMSGGMAMDSSMSRMIDSMRAEMTRMTSETPEQMKSMISMHRQMAANILAQMNSEMRSMNMSGDAAWTALVDSVRQDLVRMPDLSGAQLRTFVTAHRTRMERLMSMHRDMMGKMSAPKK